MEIYIKDGKALTLDSKFLSPAASSETWIIDERPNLDITEDIYLQIDFVSNDTSFDIINVLREQDALSYGGPTTGVFTVYTSGEWTNQAYRTITFAQPVTDNTLLTWLQANAVKQ